MGRACPNAWLQVAVSVGNCSLVLCELVAPAAPSICLSIRGCIANGCTIYVVLPQKAHKRKEAWGSNMVGRVVFCVLGHLLCWSACGGTILPDEGGLRD